MPSPPAGASAPEGCVSLRVRPLVMIARGDISIEARIGRHADHRAYDIVVTSADGYETTSGPHALAGADGPALVSLPLKGFPPANYAIDVHICDDAGRIVGRTRQQVRTVDEPGIAEK